MKSLIKKVLIFTSILLILVAVVTLAALYPNFLKPPTTYIPEKVAIPSPEKGTAKRAIKLKPGTYQTFSEDTFSKSADGRRILFFHANWCPQCRQLDKDITENTVPDGVTILKVDYDTANQLRVKYGVTLQTTVVEVDKTGEKVSSIVLYDEPTFAYLSQKLSL